MATTTDEDFKPSVLDISEQTMVLILAGGRGSRLREMTDWRAKPAVYFGGSWRIIDFALSNCINSHLMKIGVISQYQAHSLLRHLQHGWSFLNRERGQFVDMLPARQQLDDSTWYRGTADSVWQNMPILKSHYKPKYILILAGDHIYKQDYMQMIRDHIESGAQCTVGCIQVKRSEAHQFGVMGVNEKLKVREFVEKPADPPGMVDNPEYSLASMGIYVFNANYLYESLEQQVETPETSHDFGKDIIPKAVEDGVLYAHPFERSCKGRSSDGYAYWRDVGTLDSYWQANIDLTSEKPQIDIFDNSWPIRSIPRQLMPTKFFFKSGDERKVDNSLVGNGCVITDATISNSVLFNNITVDEGSILDNAVVLPQVAIGKNCVLRRCIIDRHITIPDGMQVGVDPEQDRKRFRVSENGIVLVARGMMGKYGNLGE